MGMDAPRRLRAILDRPDAEAVVGALAEQDFHVTLKEVGASDAGPLLALARPEQLHHLFDMEWWSKAEVVPSRAARWLVELAGCSERKFLQWLYTADFELLVLLFKKWLRVVVIPEDEDLMEVRDRLPEKTLDDQYFWESRYPQFEDFFHNVLGYLFETHREFYVELLNHVVWALDPEVEEGAYRFHRGRLEDRAVPDYYDALEIYRSIAPEEMAGGKDVGSSREDAATAPSFALARIPPGDLLGRALSTLPGGPLLDHLKIELASLANKVVVADRLSPEDPEHLKEGLNKVSALANLGLHLQSGGEMEAALEVLEKVFLEHLFRLGQGRAARLRNALARIVEKGWIARWPWGLNILDDPWKERAEMLLEKSPRVPRPGRDPSGDFFRIPEDLRESEEFVQGIEGLGAVLEALEARVEVLGAGLWKEAQIGDPAQATLGVLLWTAAARRELDGAWRAEPLPVEAWPELFPRLRPVAVEASVTSWLDEAFPGAPWRSRVDDLLRPLFQDYVEEMRPFGETGPPEPRLTRFFLFASPESGGA